MDNELRNKYQIIDYLIAMANILPKSNVTLQNRLTISSERFNLEQDYYGILCHVLLKKNIITSVNQFIEKID